MNGPLTVDERAAVEAEISDALASRARMLQAAGSNRHLDGWKVPIQVAAIDRHVTRLRGLLDAPTVEAVA